jgi:hypothetical protein
MFVSPTYPSVRILHVLLLLASHFILFCAQVKVNQMRYYLIDGKGRELACVSLPVMITEKESKQ